MVNKKETLKKLWSKGDIHTISKEECEQLIKDIYDSVGSCDKCFHVNTCSIYSVAWVNTNLKEDEFFCLKFCPKDTK